ncbi:hypothetical protein EVC45_37595 [Paraburkholderia sp. UYCP14C]|nr:hypothetical protein EVC45_37595 [Paraburkholderia sp. UYCP14C]
MKFLAGEPLPILGDDPCSVHGRKVVSTAIDRWSIAPAGRRSNDPFSGPHPAMVVGRLRRPSHDQVC